MSDFGRLIITDGNEDVNLLNIFCLNRWYPSIPAPKGGGSWGSSPYMPGRRLVLREFDNIMDTFELTIKSTGNINDLISELRKLRQLLEKAVSYWTSNWTKEPVWIEAKGICEEEIRYAIIVDYRTPRDDDPFEIHTNSIPSIFQDFTLILEHLIWQETQPDTVEGVEAYNQYDYNGVTYGQEATSNKDIYVANKFNEANLTHVYVYDAAPVGFGANLIGAAVPFGLLPAVPAVGDIVYFGIDTTVGDSGPFSNIIFDIGQIWGNSIVASNTGVWEYWNGAAWAALGEVDNTNNNGAGSINPFSDLGVNSVNWTPAANWVTTTVNGVTGYWVRMRVSGIGVQNNQPTQQNRDLYSQTLPYFDIDDDQLPGDIPALIKTIAENVSRNDADGSGANNYTEFIMMGSRSKDRDANFDFQGYMNISDEQNALGVSVFTVLGAFANDINAPSGRCVTYAGLGAGIDRVVCAVTQAAVFPGEYRVFLRGDITAGAITDARWFIKHGSADGSAILNYFGETERLEFQDLGSYAYIDFGKISCVGNQPLEDINTYLFHVCSGDENAQTVNLYDLILIPVDEFALNAFTLDSPIGTIATGWSDSAFQVHIDSATFQKLPKKTTLHYESDEKFAANWVHVSNGLHRFQCNADQRIWVFSARTDDQVALAWQLLRLQNERTARYLSMRGNG